MHPISRIRKNYYIPGCDDVHWRDSLKWLFSRHVPAFPKNVQIETITGCNAACVFCPEKKPTPELPRGAMEEGLFEKIVAEVAQHRTTRRVSPFLTNEPFLDKNILERSRYIKRAVPKCKVVITTNGSLLNDQMVNEIVHDNPFHAIYISIQGVEKEPYEKTMGGKLVFEKVMHNIDYLIEQRNRHLPHLRIIATMVESTLTDVQKARRYWRSKGVRFQYTALESRGGNVSSFRAFAAREPHHYRNCTRLFKSACITFDGDMVLCCTDYFRKMVLGNVRERAIYEVWNSPRAIDIRRNFVLGVLKDNPLCAQCQIAADS